MYIMISIQMYEAGYLEKFDDEHINYMVHDG
jgi:hypothetical protein